LDLSKCWAILNVYEEPWFFDFEKSIGIIDLVLPLLPHINRTQNPVSSSILQNKNKNQVLIQKSIPVVKIRPYSHAVLSNLNQPFLPAKVHTRQCCLVFTFQENIRS